jgi:uncharacterized protein YxjI
MAIQVDCICGQSYTVGDEFAGLDAPCPACGAAVRVPSAPSAPRLDPVFERDKFLLRQKHLAISEKYYIWDEAGGELLFVQRPLHFWRNLFAVFFAAIVFLIFLGVGAGLAGPRLQADDPLGAVILGAGVVFGVVAAIPLGIALSKKRHVTVYRDDSKSEPLLEIFQEKKFYLINAYYTVATAKGLVLARLHKNFIYNFFRKQWKIFDAQGRLRYVAKEDSMFKSLLRRFFGPAFGILRTNFVILEGDGEGERVIGEFNREFTLRDRYVLDLTGDPRRGFDRRVALALGVMLDTGEKR